jgi:hypothetical protein
MIANWYFKFRQTKPSPPGQWIVCGPYDSYEKAKSEREKSKAYDGGVSNVFRACSKEEAENVIC